MTLEEFFSAVDGDYSGVLSRLSKEERILKYVIKFADGSEYEQFQAALEEKNWEEAFRMIHSIKGMCLNLGLTKLAKSSSALCEMLRNGEPTMDISNMLSTVDADYKMTVENIDKLR